MTTRSAVDSSPDSTRVDRVVLGSVLLAEAALLAGLWTASAVMAAGVALGGLYLLAAYRWPDLATALVFAAAPFSAQLSLPGGAFLWVPSEPMILLALVGRAIRWAAGLSWAPRHRTLLLPIAVYLAATLLSCFFSQHTVVSIKGWTVLVGYAVFGYVAFERYRPECAERWIRIAAVTVAVVGGYGVVRILVEGVTSRAAYGIARPFFAEHGTYSAYLAVLVPLLLLLALERRGGIRWAFGSAFVLAFGGVVLSFTRAAWLSLLIVLPVTLVAWAAWRGSARRLMAPAVAAGVMAFVVMVTGLGDRLMGHAQTVVDAGNVSNLERLNRWLAGLEMARSHPWTGVGYEGFEDSYPLYRRKLIVTPEAYVRMGVHNEALRALSESGVIGLAAGIWLVVAIAAAGHRSFWGAQDRRRGLLVLGVTSGLATYFVHGWFNAYPGSDKVGLVLWMGIGAVSALTQPPKEHGAMLDANPIR